jgi:hypothetical protein
MSERDEPRQNTASVEIMWGKGFAISRSANSSAKAHARTGVCDNLTRRRNAATMLCSRPRGGGEHSNVVGVPDRVCDRAGVSC